MTGYDNACQGRIWVRRRIRRGSVGKYINKYRCPILILPASFPALFVGIKFVLKGAILDVNDIGAIDFGEGLNAMERLLSGAQLSTGFGAIADAAYIQSIRM